jgi:CMP-N-acetylneuraminic acid synthetase
MKVKEVIALVPMKAHSERVFDKNMRDFCGRPLYHYIMRTLQASRYIKEIYINTDSQIIGEDAKKHFNRVHIIERPESVQGDLISMNEIIAYDLSQIKGEYFLQTHSTNPLLTAATIDRTIECYFEKLEKHDSLFTVTRHQIRLYWQDGRPINHNPNELLRTQDLPPVFEENSNVYIFSRSSFKNSGGRRIGLRPQMFEMDRLEAIDIDEEVDFKLAEMIYKTMR